MSIDLQPPTAPWQDWTTVGCIETDRFCSFCGYNLRTQPARRDPATQVLMCRCPECGRYHAAGESTSAGRAWLHRLAALLLLIWILLIAGSLFTCGLLDFGIGVAHIDEWTMYNSQARGYVLRPIPPSVERIAMALFFAASWGSGLATGIIAVVALHHWRRWTLWILVLVIPLIAGGSVLVFVWSDLPHLWDFGVFVARAHTLFQLLGGAIGVIAGRPCARLIVRMFVPPAWRGPLAFLWLVDGKRPGWELKRFGGE